MVVGVAVHIRNDVEELLSVPGFAGSKEGKRNVEGERIRPERGGETMRNGPFEKGLYIAGVCLLQVEIEKNAIVYRGDAGAIGVSQLVHANGGRNRLYRYAMVLLQEEEIIPLRLFRPIAVKLNFPVLKAAGGVDASDA